MLSSAKLVIMKNLGGNEKMARLEVKNITQGELNYREAYSLLFNYISDMMEQQIAMMKEMVILQKQCEEICVSGLPNVSGANTDDEQILQTIVNMLK